MTPNAAQDAKDEENAADSMEKLQKQTPSCIVVQIVVRSSFRISIPSVPSWSFESRFPCLWLVVSSSLFSVHIHLMAGLPPSRSRDLTALMNARACACCLQGGEWLVGKNLALCLGWRCVPEALRDFAHC